MGAQPTNPTGVIAGNAHAQNQQRSRGGQASLGLFGIAGSGRARWADARREAAKAAGTEVAPEAQAPSPGQQAQTVDTGNLEPHVCEGCGKKASLGPIPAGQRRHYCDCNPSAPFYMVPVSTRKTAERAVAKLGGSTSRPQPPAARRIAAPTVAVGLPVPQCWQPASAAPILSPAETVAALDSLTPEQVNCLVGTLQGMVQTTPAFHARIVEALALIDAPVVLRPAPPRLRLSRERLGVFQALAAIEQRSLEDVLADHLAETAGRLLRTRHELHLDPYDQQVLAEYIDGVRERQEEWERQEAESAVHAATTPAMRQAAAAADERERHPATDLEEWDRTLPFGAVELALAID